MGKAYLTTYSYDCELAFNASDGTSTTILPQTIKYIMVEHDYKKRVMPVIYMKVNLTASIYNKMIIQQGTAKMYLKLYRTRKTGSTSSAPKKVIYDEFDYYMPDDPNANKKLDKVNESSDTSYKTCFIGLIKTSLQDLNKKTYEGIYKNTTLMSLVQSATSNMKMVIQPFTNNVSISSFMCPSVSSTGQFIAYLNSKYNFYNGTYIYYMDFDKTYLISNDGSYIDAKDGDKKYIALDIRDLTSSQALTTGMIEDEDQDAYIIYVNGADATITVDRVTSALTGEVSSINSGEGKVIDTAVIDTSKVTSIGTSGGITIVSSTDPNNALSIKTKITENTNTLTFTKLDMDSKIFTPNKQYLLSNYEDNPKYCGVYYLVSKKEIYLRTGDQLTCQMTIVLKKCADYIK